MFTKQDLITFSIGLAAALAVQLGQALVQLDAEPVQDWGQWSMSLAVGLAAAAGRYLVTELTQRRFAPAESEPESGEMTRTMALTAAPEADTDEADLDQLDIMRHPDPVESISVIKPY